MKFHGPRSETHFFGPWLFFRKVRKRRRVPAVVGQRCAKKPAKPWVVPLPLKVTPSRSSLSWKNKGRLCLWPLQRLHATVPKVPAPVQRLSVPVQGLSSRSTAGKSVEKDGKGGGNERGIWRVNKIFMHFHYVHSWIHLAGTWLGIVHLGVLGTFCRNCHIGRNLRHRVWNTDLFIHSSKIYS